MENIALALLQNLNLMWSFLLLAVRFGAFFLIIPGLGGGMHGLMIRTPAVLVLSLAALTGGVQAELPESGALMVVAFLSEGLFGVILGSIPLLIVSGFQLCGQLSSNSMGLGAAAIMDPTSGGTVQALSKLFGDLAIVLFLLMGGHHVAVYAAAGLGGVIVPGSFHVTDISVTTLIDRSADVFRAGVMLSAPVIVALLLTQFVMGLISRAVSTINIFVIAFPLTIGIGLILSFFALPEMLRIAADEIRGVEAATAAIVQDAQTVAEKGP